MQQFNVTAQIYEKNDKYKQTILMNDIIDASSKEQAISIFKANYEPINTILKIYSVEKI